jgi:flagellar basal-body rod protein FlgC
VNPIEEMVNMLEASKSYEANATVFETAKQLALRALEIGRA